MMKHLGLTLLIVVSCAPASLAVVIHPGDGSGNTTAPQDDPGFANVGLRGAGSAVYLGNRWVITAHHVGPGPVTFGDTEYDYIPSEVHRLKNPDGLSEFADIILMRLVEEPDLPDLRLSCRTAGFGQEATLVGYGHDREEDLTHWTVQIIDGRLNDIWTEVPTESEADHSGFQTTATRSLRWGKSLVTQVGFDADTGSGDVLSFQTSFQPSLKVEDLGQAVRGDSGGGIFQKNDLWELIGIIHAVGLQERQPGGIGTAIVGRSDTFGADLSKYAEQIHEIAEFGPASGDFDGDGSVTGSDIDLLYEAVNTPSIRSCHFDLSGNGTITAFDVEVMLQEAESLVGDADLNGMVDFGDFLIMARSFGQEDTGWATGNFDGDTGTNFGDYLLLAKNYGQSFTPQSSIESAAVPEPSSLLLLMLGCGVLCQLRTSRR